MDVTRGTVPRDQSQQRADGHSNSQALWQYKLLKLSILKVSEISYLSTSLCAGGIEVRLA